MEGFRNISYGLLQSPKGIRVGALGYFIETMESAELLVSNHSIKPPRRQWHFRVAGLDEEKQLPVVALSETTTVWLDEQLKKGQSFEWPGLGNFIKRSDEYLFLPSTGSQLGFFQHYGLSVLQIEPLPTAKWKKVMDNDKRTKPKDKTNWYLKVAAIVLLILGVNLVIINFLAQDGQFFKRDWASLNPFDTSVLDEKPTDIPVVEAPSEEELALLAIERERMENEADSLEALRLEQYEARQKEKQSSKVQHIVVVGAFASVKNAEAMFNHVKSLGYEAVKMAIPGSGLVRIGVFKYGSRDEATPFLIEIQKKINPDSWILAE